MRTPATLCYALGAALPLLLLACPGSLDDPDRFNEGGTPEGGAAACGDVPTTVFEADCTSAACHTMKVKAGSLDLASPGVASRLVNVLATNGGLLVDPANPQSSVLYSKITSPLTGALMPLGKPALDPATQACVLSWIQSVGAEPADAGADSP